MTAKKNPIVINPQKAGALRAKAGVKADQKIPVATLKKLANETTAAGKQTATAKQAQFALNAKSFKHPKKSK